MLTTRSDSLAREHGSRRTAQKYCDRRAWRRILSDVGLTADEFRQLL
jgi:hypothetical protein